MSFIDKDQRITSWQTKKPNITSSKPQSPLLSCLPFFHLDLNCLVQRQTSLASTSRPYICRLFLFFLATKISLYFCSTELPWAGFRTRFQCEVWANMFAAFLQPSPWLVELLMLRKPTKSSCFLEDIRFPFDCKQQITANIKSRRHPT